MPTYVALLRGINVGGHKIIRMEELRRSFEVRGCANVRSYVQSGNVIFDATRRSPAKLAVMIEALILEDYGFVVPVVVRTAQDLSRIIERNPLLGAKGIDQTKLHVCFLSATPAADRLTTLDTLDAGEGRFLHLDDVVYLYCPTRAADTKLTNNAFERALGVKATGRNWNTVRKLAELAAGGG